MYSNEGEKKKKHCRGRIDRFMIIRFNIIILLIRREGSNINLGKTITPRVTRVFIDFHTHFI